MEQIATRVAMVSIEELREIVREESKIAYQQALEEQQDELLTIGQLCEKIPGMTRYAFSKLKKTAHISNVRGKYSLKSVKAAMQSQ